MAAELRGFAAGLPTPVQFAFVAPGEPDLTAATETALRRPGPAGPGLASLAWSTPAGSRASAGIAARPVRRRHAVRRGHGHRRERLGPIRSNIPLRPEWRLAPRAPIGAAGHAMIDFGDDELTAGRAHPMIDQSLRLERLAAEAADPAVAVILLDVVLGHGAHPDPAAELGPAIAAAAAAAGQRRGTSASGLAGEWPSWSR